MSVLFSSCAFHVCCESIKTPLTVDLWPSLKPCTGGNEQLFRSTPLYYEAAVAEVLALPNGAPSPNEFRTAVCMDVAAKLVACGFFRNHTNVSVTLRFRRTMPIFSLTRIQTCWV